MIAAAPMIAVAAPITTTKYQYYNVSGKTAADIYRTMLSRGPFVGGEKAYASTTAQSSQAGALIPGRSCRIRDYKLRMSFVIKLPRVANEDQLPPMVRARWQEFSAFLKKHEETHRAIWTGCAKEFEARVKALSGSDCGKLDADTARIWEKMKNSCDRKHEAFDIAEHKRLMRHPFVRLVLGRPAAPSKTASISPRKRKKTAAALVN
jgi:predicted secreted Zn-dependent protease